MPFDQHDGQYHIPSFVCYYFYVNRLQNLPLAGKPDFDTSAFSWLRWLQTKDVSIYRESLFQSIHIQKGSAYHACPSL